MKNKPHPSTVMKRLLTPVVLAITFISIAAQSLTPDQKLRYAEGIIENFYVDTVNTDKIVEEAIIAMLKTLDPHSSYSSPQETKELTEPLNGNFSGIGIQFNMLQDTLYVIQTTSGGPSERVGILAGDRIISANDTTISGVKMKNADVIKRLRGPKGSTVDVKVLRRGEPEPIEFRITRDDIPIYSVDASYMADPTTGYIRISRFATETPEEFIKAFAGLKKKGMKNLIIDVESNGGGYLNAATQLVNGFLRNGDLIVYTDSPRSNPYYFRAQDDGHFLDGRIVVMVNQYSASASEILAGALQDNDRGLIVGRRTFGKGLVQRPFPFPDGSMIRLTVSRYYTPSGRCIQKPYEEGEESDYREDLKRRYEAGEYMSADSVHFADSLKCTTLRNGRTVYGGGGIMPDLFVPIDTTGYSNYYRDLVAKGVINRYCIDYVDNNRKELNKLYRNEDSFIRVFDVTPEMMQGMINLGTKEGVTYNEEQFLTSESTIRTIIKAVIARDLFETGSYYRVANALNPVYNEALRLINDEDEYNRLLSGQK